MSGLAVLALGVVLVVAGAMGLRSSLSPMPRPSASADLIDDGIYGRIRHPIYAGLIVAAAGWSLFSASAAAAALTVALAVLLDLKARREEAWLRERFAGYAAYAVRTKRFIPAIY